MRHPLNWLLRFGLSESDRQAILGDLQEEYRSRVRPARGWVLAQVWYARELLAAVVHGARDGLARKETAATPVPGLRHRLGLGSVLSADVRYALRRWRRRPGFAVIVVLTLGLGIGATTAMFSVVDAVLLRSLPWPEVDRVVVIHLVHPERRYESGRTATWNRGALSRQTWEALRETRGFELVAVARPPAPASQTFDEQRDEVVQTLHVSSNYLPLLGAGLVHGRYFTAVEDDVRSDSIILTHDVWRRWFGTRPDIVGQAVTLGDARSGDQARHVVVGVLTPEFRAHSGSPDVLLPIGSAARTASSGVFRAVGRLTEGTSPEAAQAEAEAVVRATEQREPTSIRLVPIEDEYLGGVARPLWLLFGGAALLLLVACSSVAGLLAGEGRARRQEIAVRLALGAGRVRVFRQLLVEHALLGVLGTAAGLVLGVWLTGVFVSLGPEGLPLVAVGFPDGRLTAFAAGLGTLAVVVAGVAPALSSAGSVPAGPLAGGAVAAPGGRHRGQRLLVALQISLALVLIVIASLLGETMYRLTSQPLGFDPSNVAVASTTFAGPFGGPDVMFGADPSVRAVENQRTREVLERLSAIPGVIDVAGAGAVPFVGVRRELGAPAERDPALVFMRIVNVTERYFDLMGMRILEGRGFDESDRPGAGASAAVVSREFERRHFSDGAVGADFSITVSQTIRWEVVGVVSNVKQRDWSDGDAAVFYGFSQQASGISHFVVKTSGDPSAVLPLMRQVIRDVDPRMVVTGTHTLESLVAEALAAERFRAALSIAFGGAALLLAAVGLYGLSARRAAERTREFGLRVALGASPMDVRRLVLRDAALIVGLGLTVGLPAGWGASQLTQSFLFGVSPTAPHVFIGASTVLAVVALVAAFLPARRASRVDPMLALRD